MSNKIITYANFTAIRNAHQTGEYVLKDTMLKIRNARAKLFTNAVSHIKNGQVMGADDSITIASVGVHGVFIDDAIVVCTDGCVVKHLSLFDNSIGIVPSKSRISCTEGATYLTHREIRHKQERFKALVTVPETKTKPFYCIDFEGSPYNNLLCVRGYENIEWLMELFILHTGNLQIGVVNFYKEVLYTKLMDIDIAIVNRNHISFRPILELTDNVLYRI